MAGGSQFTVSLLDMIEKLFPLLPSESAGVLVSAGTGRTT